MNTKNITSILIAVIFTLLIIRLEASEDEVVRVNENNEAEYLNILEDIDYSEIVNQVEEFSFDIYAFDRANIPFFNKVKNSAHRFSVNFKARFKLAFPNSQTFTTLALSNPQKANDAIRKITIDSLVFVARQWLERDMKENLKRDEKINIDKANEKFRNHRNEIEAKYATEIREAKSIDPEERSADLPKQHIIQLIIDEAENKYRESLSNLDTELHNTIESHKTPLRNAIEIVESSINKPTLDSLKNWDFVRFLAYKVNDNNID